MYVYACNLCTLWSSKKSALLYIFSLYISGQTAEREVFEETGVKAGKKKIYGYIHILAWLLSGVHTIILRLSTFENYFVITQRLSKYLKEGCR